MTYNVSDASSNAAIEVTRTVNVVDTSIPVITLTGDEIVTIEVGTAYADAGATATDNYDDDTALSSNIITVNNVDTDVVASYTVTYNVSDASGNSATEVTRTVNVVDTSIPVITLTGEGIVTIEVGTAYADGGATATDNYDDDTALSSNIITVNNVDTDVVASYTVTYNVSDASGNSATEVTRTVNVVDTSIPVITLTGEGIVTIEVGTAYADGGATATDNYDDDTALSSNIITVNNVDTDVVASYTVTYNVSDASGNSATEVTRTVNVVDTSIPVITLTGEGIVTIEVGTTYADAGATATDNYDDDTALSSNIITVNNVDTDVVASYTVTYNVSDASGNSATEVTRTVNVVDTTVPVITLTGEGIVTIEVGSTYADGGATATDNYDDDTVLTSNITTDVSDVDTQTVGSYTVSYNVSDVAGNAATEVTRTVIVEDSSLSSYDGDNENLKFIMYPNPTSDKLHIKGLNNYDLKVYNRLGQIILKANNTHAIDVSSLSVGIYLIEVSDGVKSSTKRFVKY